MLSEIAGVNCDSPNMQTTLGSRALALRTRQARTRPCGCEARTVRPAALPDDWRFWESQGFKDFFDYRLRPFLASSAFIPQPYTPTQHYSSRFTSQPTVHALSRPIQQNALLNSAAPSRHSPTFALRCFPQPQQPPPLAALPHVLRLCCFFHLCHTCLFYFSSYARICSSWAPKSSRIWRLQQYQYPEADSLQRGAPGEEGASKHRASPLLQETTGAACCSMIDLLLRLVAQLLVSTRDNGCCHQAAAQARCMLPAHAHARATLHEDVQQRQAALPFRQSTTPQSDCPPSFPDPCVSSVAALHTVACN